MKRTKRKALGQHFLHDPHVLGNIVRQINPDQDDVFIEIGAGKGALTVPLANLAGRVYAIEKDRGLLPVLQKNLPANVILVNADVLRIRFRELINEDLKADRVIKITGNLPYSISSPVLFKVLDEKELFEECTFLIQKEVADRIGAGAGSKKYAPISILFQRDFDVRPCFVVEPGSFSPPPKVRSVLIQLKRRKKPLFELPDEAAFRLTLKSAFRHRRKTLFNNLLMAGISDSLLESAFDELGVEKKVRPEDIAPEQFAELFNFLENFGIIEADRQWKK
jgi:16S rRNA (adenine1518-N6/adenine1519-N6)-dimethyltransferase